MTSYDLDFPAYQRALAVAQWFLGDKTWADTILRAYFDPDDSDAAEALAELEGSE